MPKAPTAPAAPPRTASAATVPNAAWRGILAGIDMGSNSFRLELGQLQRDQYRRVDYLKETVRLGAGLDADHRLGDAATERGLACLRRFRQRLDGIPADQVRAVATQTLREAVNRDEFLARAQEALGHPIEVISGREEARLIYKGVARLQPADYRRLVIDIGGRSTEMILGEGPTPLIAESFQIGSVSLSGRYFADGRFTAEAFRQAQIAAGAELEEAFATFRPDQFREALGSSGTAGAVAGLLAANGITDGTITVDGLRWCIERCLAAGTIDRLDVPGLKADRRAVVGGGLAILYTLLTQFGIDAVHPTRGALRQGVIFDLEERLLAARSADPHDRRDDGVLEVQRRFGADLAQAARVQDIAVRLFDQLTAERPALAGGDTRREVGWAAALHEVGMMVSHHDHHRHSAYLVAHADLDGFSQSQQRHLGHLVLGQRGGLRKLDSLLDLTPPPARDDGANTTGRAAVQLLCLRLAVILCHARIPVDASVARLQLQSLKEGGKRQTASGAAPLRLELDPGWETAHPRTIHLLREETLAWLKVDSLRLALA